MLRDKITQTHRKKVSLDRPFRCFDRLSDLAYVRYSERFVLCSPCVYLQYQERDILGGKSVPEIFCIDCQNVVSSVIQPNSTKTRGNSCVVHPIIPPICHFECIDDVFQGMDSGEQFGSCKHSREKADLGF